MGGWGGGKAALAAVIACALAACGGGGGGGGGGSSSSSSSTTPSSTGSAALVGPEGLWRGTTSLGRSVVMIIDEAGKVTYFQSVLGNATQPGAALRAQGTVAGPTASVANGLGLIVYEAFGVPSLATGATLSATVAPAGDSVSGNVDFTGFGLGNARDSFTAALDTSYRTPLAVSGLAGTYSSPAFVNGSASSATITLNLQANGVVTGSVDANCAISAGALAAHSGTGGAARGFFDIVLNLSGAACTSAGQSLVGSGYVEGTALVFLATNASTNTVFLFRGVKQ